MRFYTTPPTGVDYPYYLVNPRTEKRLLNSGFEHAIIDSGILIFHDEDIKEYPRNFLEDWKYKAKLLTEIYGDRAWCVIPDYPDDINPGQFGDNVKKTLDNIEDFIAVERVNWVVSLQARFLNLFSFAEAIQVVKDRLGDYPRIAIGTICKTNNIRFIENSCELARNHFPNSHIHAFGLTLRALPKVNGTIDSFDSMAWTFPRGRGRGSCKTQAERVQFFHDYLVRVKELVSESTNIDDGEDSE